MAASLGKLARAVLESLFWWCGHGRAGRLTNSATTQAQIQGFELAHPNIYPTYKLLECVKGLDPQKQGCSISRTQATTGYLREASVRAEYLWCAEAGGLEPDQ